MDFSKAFTDPSIAQALNDNSGTGTATRGLEEINPFDDDDTGWAGAPNGTESGSHFAGGDSAPAVMAPTTQISTRPPGAPAYSQTGQQRIDIADFERQKRELDEKAEELERREQALRDQGPAGVRRNNWPPLPEKFCVAPCFYQDINLEIPPEFQRVVRLIYYLWMYHSLLLVANFIGALALVIQMGIGEGETFGLSILYLLLFTPIAYVCWFRPVYKAFRNDSSFNFMIFFFVFFFQLMVSVVHAIGIPRLGTCGFIVGLETVTAKGGAGTVVVGVLVLLISVGFAAGALMDFVMLLKVHKIYRSSGASLAKAREEVQSGVLGNETAKNIMSDVASAAVRSQINGATGGNAPRF